MPLCVPVKEAVTVSAAVTDQTPMVLKVMGKVCVPASAVVNV